MDESIPPSLAWFSLMKRFRVENGKKILLAGRRFALKGTWGNDPVWYWDMCLRTAGGKRGNSDFSDFLVKSKPEQKDALDGDLFIWHN